MKVTFLSHMFPNEIRPLYGHFVAERAMALSKVVDLEIIAPVSYVPILRSRLPPLRDSFDGLEVSHPRYLGVPGFLWSIRWFSYLIMCNRLWKKNRPDCEIVHIEWIYPDAYAFLRCGKRSHIKTVGVVHGNEAIEYFGKKWHREKYIEALAGLDRIIVVSADLKRKLIKEYNVQKRKIVIIPNGVNLRKFPTISQGQARRKLGIAVDKPVCICVARLSSEKNLDVLIEAVSFLKNEVFCLYIAGDGPLRKKLLSLIANFGLEERIKLVGPLPHDEIHWWLNAADLFCLPSQREGCPVVVHEALACGLPVIASSVGAIPDLIRSEQYGLLCPPSDVNGFAVNLKKAMTMSWDRNTIMSYGRQFTWESVAKQTIRVFEEVLG